MATNTEIESYGMNRFPKDHSIVEAKSGKNAIDVERAKSSLTFKEVVAPGLMVEVELRRILAGPVQSLYQKIEILDTYFGKVKINPSPFVFRCFSFVPKRP
jgi:hypothetical protein